MKAQIFYSYSSPASRPEVAPSHVGRAPTINTNLTSSIALTRLYITSNTQRIAIGQSRTFVKCCDCPSAYVLGGHNQTIGIASNRNQNNKASPNNSMHNQRRVGQRQPAKMFQNQPLSLAVRSTAIELVSARMDTGGVGAGGAMPGEARALGQETNELRYP